MHCSPDLLDTTPNEHRTLGVFIVGMFGRHPNGWVGGNTWPSSLTLAVRTAGEMAGARRIAAKGPREGTAVLWAQRAPHRRRRSVVRLARMVARKSQVLKNFRDRKKRMKVVSTLGWFSISKVAPCAGT